MTVLRIVVHARQREYELHVKNLGYQLVQEDHFAESFIVEWRGRLSQSLDINDDSLLAGYRPGDELLLVLVPVDIAGLGFVVPAVTRATGSVVSLVSHIISLGDLHTVCNYVLRQQINLRRPAAKPSVFG